MKNHKLQLCIDIVYINGMTFLVSIDKEIKFRSMVHLMKRIKSLLYEGLDKIVRVYNSAGFRIKVIHADNEFRSLLEDVEDNIRPTGQKYAITPSWSKVLLLVNIVVGTLNVEPVLEPI